LARKLFRLTTGSVANGGSKSDTFTSDAAYTLKRIFVTPRGNSPLTNVQVYADIGGKPFFNPDIPAEVLDPANPLNPELEIDLKEGSKVNYKLTNNSGAAETYDITLVLDKAVYS